MIREDKLTWSDYVPENSRGPARVIVMLTSDDVKTWREAGEPESIYRFASRRHKFPKGTKPEKYAEEAARFIAECDEKLWKDSKTATYVARE